jgi:hypothetical protein
MNWRRKYQRTFLGTRHNLLLICIKKAEKGILVIYAQNIHEMNKDIQF